MESGARGARPGRAATRPDRQRATFLAVTPAGRAALADSHRWYGEVLERALADWTPGEVAALSAALGRFTGDIETALANNDNDNLEAAR
ncbi:hypothetical protein [Micromonospora sp. NPDC005220]|uniref:hypothetical protein n=1 Tax=Micromonospora sp. NPDC005220 TaxID=3155589 RepID=UPI0033AFA914